MDVTEMHIGEIYLHIELLKKAKADIQWPNALAACYADGDNIHVPDLSKEFNECLELSNMLSEKITLMLNEIFRRAKAIH